MMKIKLQLLCILAPLSLSFGQTIKLDDSGKTVSLNHTENGISLSLLNQEKEAVIWYKILEPKYKTTVYPVIDAPRFYPYKDAKLLKADYKEFDDGTAQCLVLLEISSGLDIADAPIIPDFPNDKEGTEDYSYFKEYWNKKNYLLRSYVKKEGEWKSHFSCYLGTLWYDFTTIPITDIHIKTKNEYTVDYMHGWEKVYCTTYLGELKRSEDRIEERDYFYRQFPKKGKVTRSILYDEKKGFLQVRDKGKIKNAVEALWWAGFDEFDLNEYSHGEEKNAHYYKKVLTTQKKRLNNKLPSYKPNLPRIASKELIVYFEIAKFEKNKVFTKDEIIKLNSVSTNHDTPEGKKRLERILSQRFIPRYNFYEKETKQ